MSDSTVLFCCELRSQFITSPVQLSIFNRSGVFEALKNNNTFRFLFWCASHIADQIYSVDSLNEKEYLKGDVRCPRSLGPPLVIPVI